MNATTKVDVEAAQVLLGLWLFVRLREQDIILCSHFLSLPVFKNDILDFREQDALMTH